MKLKNIKIIASIATGSKSLTAVYFKTCGLLRLKANLPNVLLEAFDDVFLIASYLFLFKIYLFLTMVCLIPFFCLLFIFCVALVLEAVSRFIFEVLIILFNVLTLLLIDLTAIAVSYVFSMAIFADSKEISLV